MERGFFITQTELTALLRTRHPDDWRVYFALRQRADFRSGRLEHYSALKMTTGSIAAEISLPSSQGTEASSVNKWGVGRSLKRLEALGLIDELKRSGKYLRLRCPLIYQEKQERKATNSPKSTGRSTTMSDPWKEGEGLTSSGIAGHSNRTDAIKPATTQANSNGKAATVANPENAANEAASGLARGGGCSLSIKNKSTITPSAIQGGNGSPAAHQNQPAAFGGSAVEIEETPEARYRRIVEDEGGGVIRFIDSKMSAQVFKGWAAIKAGERDVRDAVREVIYDASRKPTPHSVDDVLRIMLNPKKGGIDAYKGRLAL
jgi:hypothetical protein